MGLRLQGLWHDVRYSVRMLHRSPGFSLMAVAILGLGIGASTAAFSIVNSVFFRTVAVPEPERLVYVYSVTERGQRYPSYGENYVAWQDKFADVFSGITAHTRRSVMLGVGGEASPANGEIVRANYFDVLGVKLAQGRGFRPEDDDPSNTSLAVVISDSLWTQRFKRDPEILGRQARLDDKMYGVVGVTPPGFEGLSDIWSPSQFWVPVVQWEPGLSMVTGPRSFLGTVARLKPTASLEQAQTVLDVRAPALQREVMRAQPGRTWRPERQAVVPAPDVDNPFEPDSWVIAPQLLSGMAVAVGIVLVIAATNIAGVLAARSVTRSQEVAVRQALGAGASQLLRQLLTESLLLALSGGAFGLALAWMIAQAYHVVWPARFAVEATFNLRVVVFTAGVCLVTGVLVGLVPALQAIRVNVVSALASGATSGRSGRTRSRLKHAIVIPQIALSIVLLVVAGVHVRALTGFEAANPGYDIDHIVTVRAYHWDMPRARTDFSREGRERAGERDRAYARSLVAKLRDLPGGADRVAITSDLPVWGPSGTQGNFVTQQSYLAGTPAAGRADSSYVSSGYFDTIGVRLLDGRDFDDRDAMSAPAVAVVSEDFARQLWPGRSAIGESFAWYLDGQKEEPWWLQVIGIVSETHPVRDPGGSRPMVYTALSQTWLPYAFEVVARHRGDAVPVIEALKRAVASADTFSEIRNVRSLSQVADEILFPRRAAVGVLLACGIAGLLLACMGIYGVISHSVAQRLPEIGIRATLGANRGDIIALVLSEAVTVSIAGAVPALGLALLTLRLTSNVFGAVPVFDPVTFAAVLAIALSIILAASYLPARRASRLDPMAVLRGL
jgi:predicted permease